MMRTIYADLYSDTLYRRETTKLIQLAAELVSRLSDPDSFVETRLQTTQSEMIEAIERLTPLESISLCEQVCRIIRQRLSLYSDAAQDSWSPGSLLADAARMPQPLDRLTVKDWRLTHT
jgi:hypothetical protein